MTERIRAKIALAAIETFRAGDVPDAPEIWRRCGLGSCLDPEGEMTTKDKIRSDPVSASMIGAVVMALREVSRERPVGEEDK